MRSGWWPVRITFWWGVCYAALFIAFLLGLDAFWLEPSGLHAVRHKIPIARKDAKPFHKLRIAVIADLHAGSFHIGPNKIREVVRLANAQHPDIILLAGDYVTSGPGGRHRVMPLEEIVPLLKPLHAPLGVYALIGNHDRWDGADHAIAVLRNAGFTVLENSSRTVEYKGRTIYLAGIADFFTHASDIEKSMRDVPPEQPVLCLTHSPDVFPLLPERCFLTITGHTHGGQVKLPLLGRPIVPSRHGQRYAAGLIREGGKTMFVSTGIGTVGPPVRFGVPPEISILDIDVDA